MIKSKATMIKSKATMAQQIAEAAIMPIVQNGTHKTIKSKANMAQQIATAAIAFEQQRTGHTPKSVTVVMSDNTLMITLHGALSPAERALAKSPVGAAKLQDFHRQLFTSAADSLRQEIKRITGVEVREAVAEVEPTTGTVVQAFTTGTVVQVFLLASDVPSETWSGNGAPDQS
jgi:uncharacterized protein YbcI